MPVEVLRCRSCESSIRPRRTVSAPAASGRWSRCTTGTRSPGSSRANRSRPGRARCGATALCFRPSRPRTRRAGRASRRWCRRRGSRPRSASARCCSKLDPREPDALVQGPRRRDRGGQVARVRARHALGHVHRQPRERGGRARGRDGHARRRSSAPPGSSPRSSRRRRCTARPSTAFVARTTTAPGSSASSPARWSGGSSEPTFAPTTRRARRCSRVRDLLSSSGGRRRTRS